MSGQPDNSRRTGHLQPRLFQEFVGAQPEGFRDQHDRRDARHLLRTLDPTNEVQAKTRLFRQLLLAHVPSIAFYADGLGKFALNDSRTIRHVAIVSRYTS